VDEEGQAPGEAEGGEEEARDAASLAAGSIADALRKAGAGSAELDLWADVQMRRPKVDPLTALRTLAGRMLSSGRKVESTWDRPNRRGFQYLPGTRRFSPEVTVIVDTSGSMMGEEDGAHVLGNVYTVLSKLGAVRLVLCDTAVTFDGKISSLSQFRAACKGGGGTDLTPAMNACESAQAVIVLTDGYLPRPDSAMTERALWVVTRPEAVHDWMVKRIVL
jgi:predicted metal-dependent peptidase